MNTATDNELRQKLGRMAGNATDAQRQFMRQLAGHSRDPNETRIEDLVACGESQPQAIAFFRKLQEAGCGRFVVGRRTKKTRLVWTLSAKDVGRTFLETLSAPCQLEGAPREMPGERDAMTGPEFHPHTFLLRPGIQVTLQLPLDLTVEESARLAAFVRAVPFRHDPHSQTTSEEVDQ